MNEGRLADNFKGYDISPDMVRLSQVNMYLHGFVDPHIFEYDTLTSEERWNEYADVILANPPFMSPKGGIRPHSRFSVKSKRSEVLFVDYMAEHLTPNGRAGIIVPEGIIFQSQNAHKQLRKMLVEDYLVAVVSLPAGVFNPYSGVKTSILILDKSLAKRTDRIAFFKVENDGFDLGAQRRPIDKNDLPRVAAEHHEYLARLRAGKAVDDSQSKPITRVAEDGIQYTSTGYITRGLIVEKLKVAEGGEYNLSGERYRESEAHKHSKWPMVALKDLCHEILSGGTPSTKNEDYWKGDIPWITSADIMDIRTATPRRYITEQAIRESATNLIKKGNVIVVTRVGLGKLFRNDFDVCISQDSQGLILKECANADFLVYVLKDRVANFKNASQGSTIQGVTKKQLAELQIPLPLLEMQKEIVAEIKGYQRVIDGARAVVDNYRPHIVVDTEWPMVELGDACELIMDGTHFSPKNTERGTRLYITSKNVRENHLDLSKVRYVTEADHEVIYARCPVQKGDVLYIKDGANTGLAAINTLDEEFSLLSSVAVLRGKSSYLDNRYLCFFLNTKEGRGRLLSMMSGVAIRRLTLTKINQAEIPLPPIDFQKEIVAEIEAEQALVAANHELIERFEGKVQAAIARVWGEDKTERS